MPKLERLRDELALQKQLFFAAVGIVLGLSGWLVVHINSSNWLLISGGSIVVICSAIFSYTKYKRMYQLLQEIEDA